MSAPFHSELTLTTIVCTVAAGNVRLSRLSTRSVREDEVSSATLPSVVGVYHGNGVSHIEASRRLAEQGRRRADDTRRQVRKRDRFASPTRSSLLSTAAVGSYRDGGWRDLTYTGRHGGLALCLGKLLDGTPSGLLKRNRLRSRSRGDQRDNQDKLSEGCGGAKHGCLLHLLMRQLGSERLKLTWSAGSASRSSSFLLPWKPASVPS